jgi:hypothetical protein
LSLTDIRVDMWPNSLAETCRVDWKELTEVLNRPQFAQLRKVSVGLQTRHASSVDCKAWICTKEMFGLSRGLCISACAN